MLTFIVNPVSGDGRGELIWKVLEKALKKKDTEYRVFFTEEPGDAVRIADQLTAETENQMSEDPSAEEVMVAVGGDGTMNEVLNGIRISDRITLGYIPAGTGNDLARGLKLPHAPLRALKKILDRKSVKMLDYGILSCGEENPYHRRFLVSSGIGYDAAVNLDIEARRREKKPMLPFIKMLTYTAVGAGRIIKTKPVKGSVCMDGIKTVEFNHIFFVSAHIQPTEGGGVRFAPKADAADGELTACIVHSNSKRQIVRILASAYFGNHLKYAGVRSYNCKEMRITADAPLPVHTDGESCGLRREICLSCVEQKLRFIC